MFWRRVVVAAGAAGAAGGLFLSCSDGPAGLADPVPGRFAIAPSFASAAAGIVPIARVRVVVRRQSNNAVARDTTVQIAAGADSVDLAFSVLILEPDESFTLNLSLITPAGDTAFRAGPVPVTPGTGATVPIVATEFMYVGVGANAASVQIVSVPSMPVVAGNTAPVSAIAFDGNGQPIPGTPIGWRSLDTGIIAVPAPDTGVVLARAQRGTGRIVAELLTGPMDTATVAVTLPPANLTAVAGNAQSGPISGLLPNPLVARVTASDGLPVPGTRVAFAVTTGGGVLSADTIITDSAGDASVQWTLGPNVGAQTVTARSPALPGVSATFTATGVSGGAGSATVFAGDGQAALVGAAVPIAPAVLVQDAGNNPVAGDTVVFAVTAGGGTITGDTAVTNASGVATVGSWTLGPNVGPNQLTATVGTLNPVVFTALATGPNGAFAMTIQAGDNQNATVGTVLPVQPEVAVTDTAGNPAASVPVAFTVTAGGGSVGADTVLTDAQGRAAVSWTLGPAPGINTLLASVRGLPGVAFTATGLAGPPDTVRVVSGNGQNATAGTSLSQPLVVEVQDSLGNPVSGVTVTWTTLDGSLTPTTSTTDAAGRTQSAWTLGTNAVIQTATAAVSGLTPATFTATAVFPNPTILLALESGSNRIVSGGSDTLAITLTAPDTVPVTVNVSSNNPAVISVASPGSVTIPAGGTTGRIGLNAPGGGTATITASATGYQNGTLALLASVQVLSMPPTLNVPLGGTASVPLQISAPAPAGGVTVTLSSNNPSAVTLQTPSVTIPQGSQTTNATVNGIAPGAATITGTTVNFGSAQSVITTTASLNITTANVTINGSFGAVLTVRLESAGIPIAAPAPGVAVTLTSSDPGCIAATSPVTIPTGLVDTLVAVTYGGSTGLPCSGTVAASAPNIQPDTVNVTVNPIPAISATTTIATGGGLQRNGSVFLGASNHPGVDVIVKSSNPAVALVSTSNTVAGTDSIVVTLPTGSTSFTFWAQGVDGQTGAADFVITAPGFTPDTTAVTVAQPAVDIIFLGATSTTFAPPDPFQLRIGIPDAGNNFISAELTRNPGLPALTGTIILSDSTIVQLETTAGTAGTGTVQIAAGQSRSPSTVAGGGVQLTSPVLGGTTTASATIPGYVVLPSASQTVTITTPVITATTAIQTGSGLQRNGSVFLGASNHPGVDVIVKSSNPAVALVSTSNTVAGTDSIVVTLSTGQTSLTFWAQGVDGQTGAADFVVTAPGFTPDTTAVTVAQPALDVIFLNSSTTTFSTPDPFQLRIGIPDAGNGFIVAELTRNPGLPALTGTIILSDSAVAELETTAGPAGTATVQIAAGQSRSPGTVANGGVQLAPRNAGTTTASATIPGYVVLPTASQAVTISAPPITATTTIATGGGLQRNGSVFLGASNHPGVDVIVKSSNPAVALVSTSNSTPGTDSIVVTLPTGSTSFTFWAQGVDGQTGAADFVVTAPGFTPDTTAVTVAQPAVDLIFLNSSITTLSPNDPFQARIGIPDAGNNFITAELTRNPGLPPLTVTATSSAPGVAELRTQTLTGSTVTVTIDAVQSRSPSIVTNGGVELQPLTAGATNVNVSISGYVVLPSATQAVTVTTPTITLTSTTTGSGLQRAVSGFLGASNHGGTDVIVKTSNFGVLRLAPAADSAGRDSLVFTIPNGQTSFTYWVQGQDQQTGTVSVTATANGFTNGAAAVDVVAPAVDIIFLGINQTAGGPDDPFQARIGIPNAQQTGMATELVRNGGASPLIVSLTTAVPSVGTLVFQSGPAATGTVTIQPNSSRSPTTVANGGVAFRPIAAGSTGVAPQLANFIGFSFLVSVQ